jgi:disulfide oxidoreductase YuzD
MSEHTVFECDVTGERFGARNDVFEVGVKRRWSHNPFNVYEYDIHLSDQALDDAEEQLGRRLSGQVAYLEWVGVVDGQIVGAALQTRDGDPQYRERGDVVIESYESIFNYLEEEAIR